MAAINKPATAENTNTNSRVLVAKNSTNQSIQFKKINNLSLQSKTIKTQKLLNRTTASSNHKTRRSGRRSFNNFIEIAYKYVIKVTGAVVQLNAKKLTK